jgi:hypothetical protein
MNTRLRTLTLTISFALAGACAWAKIPPPPPPTDAQKAAAAEKKAKDDAAAAQAKLDQATAEDKAVKNYQSNMKAQGKPIPKPVPVAAMSTPPTGGKAGPENNTAKAASQDAKANTPNASSGGAQK